MDDSIPPVLHPQEQDIKNSPPLSVPPPLSVGASDVFQDASKQILVEYKNGTTTWDQLKNFGELGGHLIVDSTRPDYGIKVEQIGENHVATLTYGSTEQAVFAVYTLNAASLNNESVAVRTVTESVAVDSIAHSEARFPGV